MHRLNLGDSPGRIAGVTFSPDGASVIVAIGRRERGILPTAMVFWPPNAEYEPLFADDFISERTPLFLPNGRLVIAGQPLEGDRGVAVWDGGAEATVFPIADLNYLWFAGLCEGGETLLLQAYSRRSLQAELYRVGTRDWRISDAIPITRPGSNSGCLHLHAESLILAHGAVVERLDPRTGRRKQSYTPKQAGRSLKRIALSPDGSTLAGAANGNSLRLWDLESGKKLKTPKRPHQQIIRDLAFSPDGGTLAVCENQGTIRLYDARTWGDRGAFDWGLGESPKVTFAPDGLRAAAWNPWHLERGVVIWDVE